MLKLDLKNEFFSVLTTVYSKHDTRSQMSNFEGKNVTLRYYPVILAFSNLNGRSWYSEAKIRKKNTKLQLWLGLVPGTLPKTNS